MGDEMAIFLIIQMEMDDLVLKTFIFQNEQNHQSEQMEVPIPAGATCIDIKQVIDLYKMQHAITDALKFRIYDPIADTFVPLDLQKSLSQEFVFSPVIMLKYKEIHDQDSDVESHNSSRAESETKKERNRERSIKEVLQYVKQWREIHNTIDRHKNKVSLQEAAKIVGISKKSLDDYFCQLRLAEEYGFDFQGNMTQKVGVLRTYVKTHRPKGRISIKHQRLPKKLRIIEQLGGEPSFTQKQFEKGSIQNLKMEEEQKESTIESQYEAPLSVIPEQECESRFYSSFNFMLDDPEDPFLKAASNGKELYLAEEEFLFF